MPDATGPQVLEDQFLIDRIFPTMRLHVIAAPVGIGKTTFLFQLCRAVLDGTEFLGEKPQPVTGIMYLSADRTRREAYATMRRMGFLDLVPRINWVFTNENANNVDDYLENTIESKTKAGQLLIVEPLMHFLRDGNNKMGNPNDYLHVSHFLGRVKKYIEKQGITMICSLHSAKVKGDSGYAAMREKMLGSNAWGGMTSTVVFIEPTDPDDPTSPYRTIHVMPRDIRAFSLAYMQETEHGLLVPVPVAKPFKCELDMALENHPDETFTMDHLREWQTRSNVSWSTVLRWLKAKIDDGYVERVSHGVYRKLKPV